MTQRIYLSPPHQTGEELPRLQEALASNFLAPVGPMLDAFEDALAVTLGLDPQEKRVAALNSGTAALHIALRMLELGPGDVVITSDLTFIASCAPIRYLGAEPVFVDAHPETWHMDPDLAEAAFHAAAKTGRRVRALLLVDLYGRTPPSAHTARLRNLCATHGVPLVEDAAEALGAQLRVDGALRSAGTLGDWAALSFNGNKIITTAGGGALVCPDAQAARRAIYWATMAKEPAPHYEHAAIGYSSRMPSVNAAIGLAQLAALPERMAARRAVLEGYKARLADAPLRFMPEPQDVPAPLSVADAADAVDAVDATPSAQPNYWLCCATCGDPRDTRDTAAAMAMRDRILHALAQENIEARPLWKPMHMQPVFAGAEIHGGAVGHDLFERGLCLPSGSALTSSDLDRIAGIVRAAI